MKKTKINPISGKKKQWYRDEMPIRVEIIRRCGGLPVYCEFPPYVICAGGHCEKCGGSPLHPGYPLTIHHKTKRSQGGKLEKKEDGEALCVYCHGSAEGLIIKRSQPQWSVK